MSSIRLDPVFRHKDTIDELHETLIPWSGSRGINPSAEVERSASLDPASPIYPMLAARLHAFMVRLRPLVTGLGRMGV